MKIVTEYWPKPIPPRQFDWTATYEGYEPGDPIGHGRTEQEAIADLQAGGESPLGDAAEAHAAEIKRLRSIIKGAEIALARDSDIGGAMKCLLSVDSFK